MLVIIIPLGNSVFLWGIRICLLAISERFGGNMTFQYIKLAVGRLKQYGDIVEAVPLDRNGNELPPVSERTAMILCATKKVLDYEVRDNIMFCRLDTDFDKPATI